MLCINCGKETKNPKFCSRSCAAKHNNVRHPKRKREGKCSVCGEPVLSQSAYCSEHKPVRASSDMSLRDAIYTRHHKSSAFAKVRTRARKVMAKEPRVCKACGYDKHVEVCHIKGISEFEEDALLSHINDPRNLVLLCPNCHWEFDNGLLAIS